MDADMIDRVFQLHEELRQTRACLRHYKELLLSIQKAVMPEQLPLVPGLDLSLHFSPCDEVGGDFYGIRPAGPGRWAIVVADACGHGLAAATVMAVAHALGTVWHDRAPPRSLSAALSQINQLLVRYLANTGRFATAFASIYDTRSQHLVYASAGHPPARLVHGRRVLQLDAVSGPPLGIAETSTYEEASVRLLPGDRVVIFTDGMTEARNVKQELLGDSCFDEILAAPAATAAELVARLTAALRTFRAGRPPEDDETCLVCFVTGPVEGTVL